jgi:hypothetical protein
LLEEEKKKMFLKQLEKDDEGIQFEESEINQ